MDIPVIVTPKVTPVVVPVGALITPDDVKGRIDLPKGWKVTKTGEIPTTTTPGVKPVVPVEVELPDGRKITVDVPVIVTPTVRQIVVPQGTPITPDDVKGHIDLPKEPGWEIVEVGEIPTTATPGTKPVVPVEIELPDGSKITLEVPVTVTPKDTPVKPTIEAKPIVVAVGDPVTKEDVEFHINLLKGAEIGEIPTTETPGQKPSVKVKVKLPSGEIIEVEVPVIVTLKVTSTPRPEKPSTTEVIVTPTVSEEPKASESTEVKETKEVVKELSNTGTKADASLAALGLLGVLSGFGLLGRKKKKTKNN